MTTTSVHKIVIRYVPLVLGPLLLLLVLLVENPDGLALTAWLTLGIAIWMAIWWATEVVPIPVTALLPLILVPLTGVGSFSSVAPSYAHPIIFLFFGGFLLGMAMQRWELHRRMALLILRRAGASPRRQIGGFMLATAFLSMWVSNTATSIMMLPIALSVIALSRDQKRDDNFAVALLLAVAYSASIGGIATLIGTPPNALLAAYLQSNYGIEIGFAQWMCVGLPVSGSMLLACWWWLCRRDVPAKALASHDTLYADELEKMGPLPSAQKRVLVVFLLTAAAWIFRPLLSDFLPALSDTTVALIAGVALFLIPAGDAKKSKLLDWEQAQTLPWGILLLFGGGLALAAVIQSSGLAQWIASGFSSLGSVPTVIIVLLIVSVIIFLTEITSNTATTASFLPLLGALAVAQSSSPLLYTVPAAIAASCAFMMPVATPPNAVVFGSGEIRISQMMRHGFVLNLFGILLVTGFAYLVLLGFWI